MRYGLKVNSNLIETLEGIFLYIFWSDFICAISFSYLYFFSNDFFESIILGLEKLIVQIETNQFYFVLIEN